MIRVITADDFGLTQQTIREVTKRAKKNHVDYVSIMVNTSSTKEAMSQFKINGLKNAGLHFNVVEGLPVSLPSDIPSLINEKGQFYSLPFFMIRLLIHKINLDEVETEFSNQLAVLKKNNITCIHLNSHQNVHSFLPIYTLLARLTKKNGIHYLRNDESIRNRLKRFPIRYIVYVLFSWLYSISYLNARIIPFPSLHEEIIHPGTNYD